MSVVQIFLPDEKKEFRLYYPVRHAEFISASKSGLTLRDPETRSECGLHKCRM